MLVQEMHKNLVVKLRAMVEWLDGHSFIIHIWDNSEVHLINIHCWCKPEVKTGDNGDPYISHNHFKPNWG